MRIRSIIATQSSQFVSLRPVLTDPFEDPTLGVHIVEGVVYDGALAEREAQIYLPVDWAFSLCTII